MIRLAKSADIEALAALRFALWPDEPLEVRRAETEANVARDDGLVTFVAEDAGEVIAFAEVSLRHDYVNGCESSPVAFLEGIYVRPDHRGRGVARALVSAAEQWGSAQACRELASDAAGQPRQPPLPRRRRVRGDRAGDLLPQDARRAVRWTSST